MPNTKDACASIDKQMTLCEASVREDWQLVDCDPINETVTYKCRMCGAVSTVAVPRQRNP